MTTMDRMTRLAPAPQTVDQGRSRPIGFAHQWLAMAIAETLLLTCFGMAQEPARVLDQVSSTLALPRIYGAILPAEKVDLGFRREGMIATVHVQTGQAVEAGELVISIEDREFLSREALAAGELRKAQSISQDQSAVMAARAQLARSEATWTSHQNLKQKSELELFRLQMDMRERQASLDLALSKHDQDTIEVAIKKEMHELARIDREACRIVSPISGIVAEQWKYPGEAVRSGEAILKIIRMDELVFRVELDMREMPPDRLSEYTATVVLSMAKEDSDEIENVRFDRILPSNVDDQHYYALAKIQNTQHTDRFGNVQWRLRPGMSGEVVLQTTEDRVTSEPKGHFTSSPE